MNSTTITFNDLIEYCNLPEKTSNILKKKYKYDDETLIEIEYYFTDSDTSCYNIFNVICETEHFKFKNSIEYNTSSTMAMWICDLDEE